MAAAAAVVVVVVVVATGCNVGKADAAAVRCSQRMRR